MAFIGDDNTQRFLQISDVSQEPEIMNSVFDRYEKTPLVSLEKAVEPLVSLVPEVQRYAAIAKKSCDSVPADGLTIDESASIRLLLMEWKTHEQGLYAVLSSALRNKDKNWLIPWFWFLKLILTALFRLPSHRDMVFRGMKWNLGELYPKGKTFVWWGFSSCTSSPKVLENEQFLGCSGKRTIFAIDCDSGKDISRHSDYPMEHKILLPAGRQFEVIDRLQLHSDLYIIHLKEIPSTTSLLQPAALDFNSNKSSSVSETKQASTPTVGTQLKTDKIQGVKSYTTDKKTTTKEMNASAETNSESATSPFYNACRDNNIGLVEHYLETMSLEEINQMEPNGSTALHVAAYRGYTNIVELLLEMGASQTTINKYNATPLDEAKTDEIKQMIRQRRHKTRFISDCALEWIVSTDNADFQAHEYSKKLEAYGIDPHFHQFIIYIKQNYLEKDLQDIDDIDTIKQYFDKAINKKNPVYLLKAYTAETGFYSKLNVHLAQLQLENLTNKENLSRAYYIGIIAYHPQFETLSYTGKTFRGMMITNDDLKQYKVGTRILTKTFSSTSKQLAVALQFLGNNRDTDDRFSTICIYKIRNQRTALDIEHMSEYPSEEEVLILPYSAFKIIDIKQNKHKSPRVEIELKECEPW